MGVYLQRLLGKNVPKTKLTVKIAKLIYHMLKTKIDMSPAQYVDKIYMLVLKKHINMVNTNAPKMLKK